MRLVLDTQVWLDWLLFRDASAGPIVRAYAAGEVEIVIDAPCAEELARAAGYDFGRHTLDAAAQQALLAECRRIAAAVEAPTAADPALPRCRDPDDQKFLELASASRANALITKDRALLELARGRRAPPFSILHPRDFADALQRHRAP